LNTSRKERGDGDDIWLLSSLHIAFQYMLRRESVQVEGAKKLTYILNDLLDFLLSGAVLLRVL
jgi:hypothetical protein